VPGAVVLGLVVAGVVEFGAFSSAGVVAGDVCCIPAAPGLA
jgi:hypothetical protein